MSKSFFTRTRAKIAAPCAALSLALSLLFIACGDGASPAPAGEDNSEGTTSDPAGAGARDSGAGVSHDGAEPPSVPSNSAKPDAGSKPSLDAGSDPSKGAIDAGTVVAPDVDVSADASLPAGDGGFVPPWVTRADLGKGNGSDVVTIGDSWMAGPLNGAGIQAGLDRAGTKYRHYAVTATTLLSGQIPSQYDQAKTANPKISTVIMTGGGNDVMFTGGSCDTPEACEAFAAKITAGLNDLWTKMAADGVQDVIYIQYSDSAGSTPTENRGKNKATAPICSSGKISCHVVPTTDLIAASDLLDGIHPNSAGNDRIAKRVLMLMEERKIRR